MVTRAKPDPEIYLRALSELGLSASESLVFEDAIAGIMAGVAAGMKVVALSTTVPAKILASTPGVVLVSPDFTALDYDSLDALTA
jgi:beta-phosphoglucomutase-like phosphatase (HAD superfamily)